MIKVFFGTLVILFSLNGPVIAHENGKAARTGRNPQTAATIKARTLSKSDAGNALNAVKGETQNGATQRAIMEPGVKEEPRKKPKK